MKGCLKRMFLLMLGSVVTVYLIVIAWAYFMQPNMVYFPSTIVDLTPETINLEYEDVSLTTADNIKIHGWFIPAETTGATILICHGNGGNISDRMESIAQFHRMGLSVLIFDYRGYGNSEGKPDEAGTYADADAAWDYLVGHRNIEETQIIVFGQSLGGAVGIELARKHKPMALIVESSFTSLPDIAAKIYPLLPVRLLSRYDYKSAEKIGAVDAPVLVIHSRDDDMIPFSHGQKLFDLAGEPKQFLEITGTHNDGYITSGEVYQNGLESFINPLVNQSQGK